MPVRCQQNRLPASSCARRVSSLIGPKDGSQQAGVHRRPPVTIGLDIVPSCADPAATLCIFLCCFFFFGTHRWLAQALSPGLRLGSDDVLKSSAFGGQQRPRGEARRNQTIEGHGEERAAKVVGLDKIEQLQLLHQSQAIRTL